MPKYSCYFICIILLVTSKMFGQNPKKTLHTKSTTEKIIIDGKFDEASWKNAEIATDFLMNNPDNGKPEKPERKSEVKVIYTNEALYIAASLYDNEPLKIGKELTLRDNFVTADHFGVQLNGYNDGQQEFRFFVSAAGVQMDCVYTENNGEDFSWDAIWDSQTAITETGWVVEMKIPYAAIRFPSDVKQTWGINFYREIIRDRQQFSWNLINNNINNEANQAGILEGIENIKTPTRLFLIPYASTYLTGNASQKTIGEVRGGLDIKYGINDAFTLDAILVPDFGQVRFDNVILNLTAFEQQFTENRPFFTEGTDLFNKGNLLYSRRIGEVPSFEVEENETVVDNLGAIRLINAAKISGRTKSGLGIGFLNAATENTSVTVKNEDTGTTRLLKIAPFTNYNVIVLDQRFRKNSSIAFINTNVMREGTFRDANVSALAWDLNTKSNSYNISGDFKFSYVNEIPNLEDRKGINSYFNFGKTKGKYRINAGGQYVSRYFDNNDLGIIFQTNYHSAYLNGSYRILNPSKLFNTFSINANNYIEFDNRSGRLQQNNTRLSLDFTTKKNDYFGMGMRARPFKIADAYEPLAYDEGKFVIYPGMFASWFYFSSNYNRKFAIDLNPYFTKFFEKDWINYGFNIVPRYRFNDQFSLVYSFLFDRTNNDVGRISFNENENTIFARRRRVTFENTIQGKYSINETMNFNLNLRHYWSYVINENILTLQNDGSLLPNNDFTTNRNRNLSLWNLDFSYVWWFTPGSQVTVLYRNNASVFNREFSREFNSNFNDVINERNLNHIFSISVRYFIDYNSIKNSRFVKSFTKPKERIHF
jgi:hypothetical protein